jgi:aminoglycoside 6'-N-acetyltransferase
VQGHGLGPEAIRLAARDLIERRAHHRITIDPAADNERAIRAYAKVGFRPVGRLRRYQRYPDGSWRDGLLMEMLAEELRDR